MRYWAWSPEHVKTSQICWTEGEWWGECADQTICKPNTQTNYHFFEFILKEKFFLGPWYLFRFIIPPYLSYITIFHATCLEWLEVTLFTFYFPWFMRHHIVTGMQIRWLTSAFIAMKWTGTKILHHSKMLCIAKGHPTTIFGKYLFGRRFEI